MRRSAWRPSDGASQPAPAAERLDGWFIAFEACEAFQSKNKGTNPGDVLHRAVPGLRDDRDQRARRRLLPGEGTRRAGHRATAGCTPPAACTWSSRDTEGADAAIEPVRAGAGRRVGRRTCWR